MMRATKRLWGPFLRELFDVVTHGEVSLSLSLSGVWIRLSMALIVLRV